MTRKNIRRKKMYAWWSGVLLLVIIVVVLSVLFRYFIRKHWSLSYVPDTRELYQVTELPQYAKNVLGSSTTASEPSVRLPILMYHYVEYVKDRRDTIRMGLDIQPNTLTAQIETLKNDGYLFVTPGYLTLALKGKIQPQTKIIMLTFDDGYRDFYTDVLPILEKEHVPAVAYIVPNFLNHPNYMTTAQVSEIAKSPWVVIGAHTMDHLWLKGLSFSLAQSEIIESRRVLRSMLHVDVNSFAYPYGAFDEQAEKIVESAGFTDAVATVPGIVHTPETQYFLYRLRPGGRTGPELLKFLQQDKFTPW